MNAEQLIEDCINEATATDLIIEVGAHYFSHGSYWTIDKANPSYWDSEASSTHGLQGPSLGAFHPLQRKKVDDLIRNGVKIRVTKSGKIGLIL